MKHRIEKLLNVEANDQAPGALLAHGETVPTDGDKGYAKGCLFQNYGDSGDPLYVNTGDETSCNFDSVDTTA